MKRLVCLGCAIILAASSHATDQKEANSVIAKTLAAYVKAIKNRDYKWFEQHSSKDFNTIDPKGKRLSRTPALEELKQSFSMMKKVNSVTAKAQKVSVNSQNEILCTYTDTIDVMIPGANGKLSRLVMSSRTDGVLVKEAGIWKMKTVHTLKDSTTIDGVKLKR